MPLAVFALAAINVAIGTQSFVFAGLLSELAGDLGISIGTAGLLVPASAITFAVAAPFATALVSGFERKRVMVASLAVLALCNALCAIAPTFGRLLALRILGGVMVAFAVMALDMSVYAWALGQPAQTTTQPFVAGLIFLLASTMFAAVPMNLAQLSQLAGPAAPVALALNGSLVSFGQGLGAIWGGAINDFGEPGWIGAGGAFLATGAFALACLDLKGSHVLG